MLVDGVLGAYGDWFPVLAATGRLLERYRYGEQVEPCLSLNVNFLVLSGDQETQEGLWHDASVGSGVDLRMMRVDHSPGSP